jgi:tagatose-1,6-bisphosphate aldolase non-catalytic subunit AgaZ/GatZ
MTNLASFTETTVTGNTDAERAAAARLVARNATDHDDEQQLLEALGLDAPAPTGEAS